MSRIRLWFLAVIGIFWLGACAPRASTVPLSSVEEEPPPVAKKSHAHADSKETPKPPEVPAEPEVPAAAAQAEASEGTGEPAEEAQEGEAENDTIRFTRYPPQVGDRSHMALNLSASGALGGDMLGEPMNMEFSLSGEYATRRHVRRVRDGRVTELDVTFLRDRFRATVTDRDDFEEVTVLEGHSYRVIQKGDAFEFETDRGGSVSLEEQKELSRHFHAEDHAVDEMAFVPEEPEPGDSIELDAKALTALFGAAAQFIDSARVEFRGTERVGEIECGVFDVTASADVAKSGVQLRVEIQGVLHIALDGTYPVKAALSGTISTQGPTGGLNLQGSGRFEARVVGGLERAKER